LSPLKLSSTSVGTDSTSFRHQKRTVAGAIPVSSSHRPREDSLISSGSSGSSFASSCGSDFESAIHEPVIQDRNPQQLLSETQEYRRYDRVASGRAAPYSTSSSARASSASASASVSAAGGPLGLQNRQKNANPRRSFESYLSIAVAGDVGASYASASASASAMQDEWMAESTALGLLSPRVISTGARTAALSLSDPLSSTEINEETDVGNDTGVFRGEQRNQGANEWAFPVRRPRQFSISSTGSW
jgi:hypothetical protein